MPAGDAVFGDEIIGNPSGDSSREYPADFGGLVDEALAATEIRIGPSEPTFYHGPMS
jgi:hypothetical protein